MPTDETLTVVRDNLAVDLSLEDHTYPNRRSNGDVDFLCGNGLFRDGVRHISTRKDWLLDQHFPQ